MNSAAKNSNKFQKTRFWKENSVEDVVTLESLPFNSSTTPFHIWLFKKSIHTLQNNVHMLSFHILGFTLGPRAQATLVFMVCAFESPSWGGGEGGRGGMQGGPMSSVIIKMKSTLLPFGETK